MPGLNTRLKSRSKSGKQMSGGCLSLFGLPFLLAGIALSGVYFSGFSEWWRAQVWEEVPCWIESSELKVSRGDDSTTYQALATYRYEYGGKQYQGDRVSFGKGSDNIGGFQKRAHREISKHMGKKGKNAKASRNVRSQKPFRCFVNPGNPDEAVLYREFRWSMQAFMAIFALTFPAVGAGLVAGGLIGTREAKRDAVLRENYPGEPWKWRTRWSGRTIPADAGPLRNAVDYYTLWASLVVIPLIVTAAKSGVFLTEGLSWLLLIFVAFWCLPAWFTLKRFRQRRAIGVARLELAEVPAWPGGRLSAVILLERPLPMNRNVEVSFSCLRSVTRQTSDGSSTSTEEFWSRKENVPMDSITRAASGFRVPVSFELPGDAPQSGPVEGDDATKHEWKLQLKVPGTAISPSFEVPVFRTGKSPALGELPEESIASVLDTAAENLPGLLAERRIRAEFDSVGLPVSIHCPVARNRGMIGFLLVFNLIWTAASVFLIYKEAPWVFRIVWPVSCALIWWTIIYQLIQSLTATFDPLGMTLVNRLGPWVRTLRLGKPEITGFSHDSNASSGNTKFYRVRMEDVFGRKKTVADNITGLTTVAALVERLESWRKSG